MTIRRVLKPFRFSLPAVGGERLHKEHVFAPGDVDIDEELLAHPWMKAGADGCLESHEATVARTKAAKDHADAAAALAAKANEDAQAAADRMTRAYANDEANRAAVRDQLNTPIGEIRARQNGVNEVTDPELLKALNTPVSQLQGVPDGGSGLEGGPSTDAVTESGVADVGGPPPTNKGKGKR